MSTVDTLERTESGQLEPQRPRRYGAVVLGALFVVGGGLWMLDILDVIELQMGILLPAFLAVIGLALVIGSFDGTHPGLITAGVLVALASLAVVATPHDAFRGGIGDRTVTVSGQETLLQRYDIGMGNLTLDLSELEMTVPATVEVTAGAGNITVILPQDVTVAIEASAGAGQIDLLGRTADGLSVDRSYVSEGIDAEEAMLTLDLDVAAGNIEVTR